jgi:hypothetical protein
VIILGDPSQTGRASATDGFSEADPAQDDIPEDNAEDHPGEEKDDASIS